MLGLDAHTLPKGSNLLKFSYTLNFTCNGLKGFREEVMWMHDLSDGEIGKECIKLWDFEENFALNYCI